jgi:hypothetical protein
MFLSSDVNNIILDYVSYRDLATIGKCNKYFANIVKDRKEIKNNVNYDYVLKCINNNGNCKQCAFNITPSQQKNLNITIEDNEILCKCSN